MTSTTPLGSAFGRNVRAIRTRKRLTQAALAEECQVHWTMIGQIERGERRPGIRVILSLAYGLDVRPGELLEGVTPDMYLRDPDAARARRPGPLGRTVPRPGEPGAGVRPEGG